MQLKVMPQDDTKDKSLYNFNWTAKSLVGSRLVLAIEFKNALEISQGRVHDSLMVKFLKPSLFVPISDL